MKESIYFNIGNFLYLGAQWLISVALVRLGGFEDAGLFSLAMTICNVVVAIGNYGLRPFHISDIKNRYSDYTYIISRIFTIVVACVFGVSFILVKGYESYTRILVFVYMLHKAIEAYCEILNGIWQKKEGMKKVGVSLGSKGVLNTIFFMGSYIVFGKLLLSIGLMVISSALVMFFYDFKNTTRFVEQSKIFRNIDGGQVTSLLKQGFLTMIVNMCIILFNSVPKLIIEDVLDTELLGVFSSIATPTVVISTFAIGVLLPIAPKMAESYESANTKKLLKLMCSCDFIIIGVGVLATIFSVIAGEFVFKLVFGEEILSHFNLFYYMIWVSVLIAMVNCYTTVLIAVRKLKSLVFFSVAACVIEYALCMLLIAEKSIYGAGYAMLIALVIQFVAETVYIMILLNKRKRMVKK